jgi:hypothetical protein
MFQWNESVWFQITLILLLQFNNISSCPCFVRLQRFLRLVYLILCFLSLWPLPAQNLFFFVWGPCSTNGEKKNAYRLLVGNPEGKRPLGRPTRRWVDNIRMDLGEVGWGDMDCIGLAQDRNRWRAVVNSVLNLRVPWNVGKLSIGLTSSGLSSSAQLHKLKLNSMVWVRERTIPTERPPLVGEVIANLCG